MEDLITAFNVVLNFVDCVQQSCDRRRNFIESSSNKEFLNYVREWNRKEEERKQKEEKEKQEPENGQAVQENLEVLELEEIAKADNLLQKARLIREKFKVPSLDDFDEPIMFTKTSSGIELECCTRKELSQNKPLVEKLKQSMSMPSINSNRKNITNFNRNHQIKDQNNGMRNTLPRDKCPKTFKNIAVVTKVQLHSYRHVSNKSTLRKDAINMKKNTPSSKSNPSNCAKLSNGSNKTSKTHLAVVQSANLAQSKYQPTYQDFVNFTHECQNFLHTDLSQSLWYPFLDSTNASRLTSNVKCRSAKELRQVYILLYHIQEMAFWLDLFHLVGRELIPKLKSTNINQKDAIVIQSYVQSLFHPKFHRTPIVLQPDLE